LDINNQPVPYANIFIKELNSGTSTDINGIYYIQILSGNYSIVISSVGYKTMDIPIIVPEKGLVKNIILEADTKELEEIIVKAKRKDPAYEIIQNAIENREINQFTFDTYSVNIYLKAEEYRNNKLKKDNDFKESGEFPDESFEEINQKTEEQKEDLPDLSINETQILLHVKQPDKIKEIKKASKTVGTPSGLFIPNFFRDQMDFYNGLVHPKKITETPWISPLNRTSILSYKYKLVDIYYIDSVLVYHIKVTPRKSGNSTLTGNIHIRDSTWSIYKLNLSIKKGGLLFYDEFEVSQDYELIESHWLKTREEFIYKTGSRKKDYEGSTVLRYTDHKINPQFPEKYFNNEVGYTEEDAYEKDTTYWKSTRLEPLTPDQLKVISHNDSIEAAHSSDQYLDSLELLFNKVTFLDVLYEGISFRNRKKEHLIRFSSIGSAVNPFEVAGLRMNPAVFYNKILPSGKRYFLRAMPSYGFRNKDLKGSANVYFNYNPFNFSSIFFSVSKSFDFINSNDAYIDMVRRSNFYEKTSYTFWHTFEPLNGLRIYSHFDWSIRNSIEGYDFGNLSGQILNNQEVTPFDKHKAFSTTFRISWTPAQAYYREPKRKIILGSKYPTFTFTYQKGWPNIGGSAINYDFINFKINQRIHIRSLGTSKYSLQIGKFINDKSVMLLDYKRFRRGDPILFSDPSSTYQLLDASFEITSLYFESHYIHHFNGVLVNNIPLIKKLKLRTVAGAGFLYLIDENYKYGEVYAGVERVFKLGPRRRLKIGGYGITAQSNWNNTQFGWKISFDIIDTWNTNWNF